MTTCLFRIRTNFVVPTLLIALLSACGGSNEKAIEIKPAKMDQTIEQYAIEQNFSGAILIVENEQVLFSKGFNKVNRNDTKLIDADTVFRLASISKQFTATGIMILQEQGLLSIQDTLNVYLPDFPNGDKIRIKHLLQHSAGLANFTALSTFKDIKNTPHTPEQLIALFKDRALEFNSGSQYKYSNSGYIVLGHLIEKVSGMTYQDFINTEIFHPLEMAQSGYGKDELGQNNIAQGYLPSGANITKLSMTVPFAAGALVSSANDLHKWDQSFYNNTLLNEASQKSMFTPELGSAGLGWFITQSNGELRYVHSGGIDGFSTYIARYPESKKLIVVLSNVQNFPAAKFSNQLNKIITND
ncbi:beta-lactamase family protein [Pseudoalteromonas sp. MMG013]|uniref:serine hydrolase domain-containing protein n=1 Tax=Pseudoalteromonas sp. MMG013 TaxID=2822687 RepID=UPI001B3758CD|nr:serine hydrolase domain-containing protein [Pseudoalteromonas sp. MMG013]MBQ4861521.1 beta-lactamase family protein [Pseudoalteromonas sp. MMG013]